jgi:hypothetical protein
MTNESDIRAIKARHQEIAQEIERLKAEADELAITLRVLDRFSSGSAQANGEGPKLGPPRPADTPSLFNMTVSVISDAVGQGKTGLRGQEIVAAIGKRFWPGVQSKQVLPPIYQFAKKGRLIKTKDGLFKVVSESEGRH